MDGPVRRHAFLVGTDADGAGELDEPLAGLIELFMLGHRLPVARARAALEPVDLEEVAETGLLTVAGEWVTPEYRLRPHDQLLLAGDVDRPEAADLVSAFTGPTLTLARLIPRTPSRRMLDVGTGSGILALLGAAHCEHVTATDLNRRALMFARFNAELNGISNLELLEGSWFEPVVGRCFDLVVCNPPYLVSPDQEFIYRDSGLAGTTLLEQLIRQASEHLTPGGLAVMLCSWPHQSADDWAAVPNAAVSGTDCDALIIGSDAIDPFDYAVRWNTPPVSFVTPHALRETVARWRRYYRAIGAGAITFGAIILRRRSRGTPWVSAFTARTGFGEGASEQLTAMLAGHDLLEALDDRALLARRLSLCDGLDVSQRFGRREGRFVARPAMVKLDGGIGVSAAVDPDALDVVFACDGRRTLREAVERAAGRSGKSTDEVAHRATAAARELLRHGLLSGA